MFNQLFNSIWLFTPFPLQPGVEKRRLYLLLPAIVPTALLPLSGYQSSIQQGIANSAFLTGKSIANFAAGTFFLQLVPNPGCYSLGHKP